MRPQSPRTPTPASWFSLTSAAHLPARREARNRGQRAQRKAARIPRLSREQSRKVLQPDAGAAQLRRAGVLHCPSRRTPGWKSFTPGSTASGRGSAISFARSSRPTRATRSACGGWAESEQPKGPKVESFAQVPVLNQQQVVSVWKWNVPSHEQWESMTVTVPVSDKGVYLVEATDGTLRAYTIVVITDIAIITKAGQGRLMSFVVDRRSGDPIAGHAGAGLDRSEGSCVQDHRSAGTGRHADQRSEAGERRRAGDQRRPVRHQHARRRGTWATIPIAT